MKSRSQQTAVFRGLKSGLNSFRWIAVGMVVLFACSGLTSIHPGEVGLLLRMGRLHGAGPGQQIKQPGLLPALPDPIDQVVRVPVKQEGQIVIEDLWQPLSDSAGSDRIDPLQEGYCLTGDQYILQAKVVVKYRISDPILFRLGIENADAILKDMVLASLTQTIASWNIDDGWRRHRSREGGGQISLEQMVLQATNERLRRLDIGVTITAIEFQEIHPPRHVRKEFADVQNALNEKQRDRDQAQGDADETLLAAKAESKRIVEEAGAERERMLAQANSEVSVIQEMLEEYRNTPELVRQRMRLEALTELQRRGVRQKVVPHGQPWRMIISDSEETAR